MEKNVFITCPHCGREYTLEEIFLPEDILGNTVSVRDENGKIVSLLGQPAQFTESFVCEGCDKEFNVSLTVKAKTTKPAVSFDEEDF